MEVVEYIWYCLAVKVFNINSICFLVIVYRFFQEYSAFIFRCSIILQCKPVSCTEFGSTMFSNILHFSKNIFYLSSNILQFHCTKLVATMYVYICIYKMTTFIAQSLWPPCICMYICIYKMTTFIAQSLWSPCIFIYVYI